ncbi:MAG: DUF1080 domain-containing protein [Verrucomicrobiae bacterium]|nr:DUF1080 domain-containing protein [Verrucomicrobiae bacterium]
MKTINSFAGKILVILFLTAIGTTARSGEFIPLFNGKDLTGWKVPDPNPFWKVVDGILVGENDEKLKGSMLYTEKSYKDFIFEADARWTGEIDSGFMIRKPELQMQIGVSRSLKRDMTCSFYTGGQERYPEAGQAKDIEKVLKQGDWNTIRLQAKGDTFTVWCNGIKVTEYTNPKYASPAPIGLQIHPGVKMKIEFRNIKIQELQ